MKILKNSTYEGLLNEIEEGKKKIKTLSGQVLAEKNNQAAILKEKQDLEGKIASMKEDYNKLLQENERLKNQLDRRNPKRGTNGRFAKKKDNE